MKTYSKKIFIIGISVAVLFFAIAYYSMFSGLKIIPAITNNGVYSTKTYDQFKDFKFVNVKGKINLNLIKSDSTKIEIKGGSFLLDRFFNINRIGDTLFIEVPETFEYDGVNGNPSDYDFYYCKGEISLPELNNIYINPGKVSKQIHLIPPDNKIIISKDPFAGVCRIEGFESDSLKIIVDGTENVNLNKINIKNLNAIASNGALIWADSSLIANIEYDLFNFAKFINMKFNGTAKGKVEKLSSFEVLSGKKNSTIFSTDYQEILDSLGEVLPGINWGAGIKEISDELSKKFIVDPNPTFNLTMFYSIDIKGAEFLGLKIDEIIFSFLRGMLASIIITGKDNDGSFINWAERKFGKYEQADKLKYFIQKNKTGEPISIISLFEGKESSLRLQSSKIYSMLDRIISD